MAAGPGSKLMQDFFRMVTATTDDHVRADVAALSSISRRTRGRGRGRWGASATATACGSCSGRCPSTPVAFAAGVGLHPSFCVETDDASPHHCVSRVTGHLYIAIGGSDHLASVEHNQPLIDELRELGDRATVEILPGADHGFAMPGPSYHEAAAARSFEQSLALFRRTIG